MNLRTLIATLAALGRVDEAADVAQQLLRIKPDVRVGDYARRRQFLEPMLGVWLDRLRLSGRPE